MKRKHISGQDFTLQKKETQDELKKRRKAIFGEIRTTLLVIFAAAVLGYAFVTSFLQTVTVQGPSMDPTLKNGETVLVNKMAYAFSDVERGDVVAIKPIGSDDYYDIKRVIGLPGDKVAVVAGRFVINDKELDPDGELDRIQVPARLSSPITLGDKEYFVIGDNLNSSEDSRFSTYGNIQQSEIRGKVFYRLTKGSRGRIGRKYGDTVVSGAHDERASDDAGSTETN